MQLQDIYTLVSTLMCLGGAALLLIALLPLAHLKSCEIVDGEIVNFTQEYSTRGFIRKAQVRYTFEGKTYTYTSPARTFKRYTGETIKLRVNDKGKIVDFGKAIEFSLMGVLMIVIAVILLTL